MQQWEYKELIVAQGQEAEALRCHGLEGWELCSAVYCKLNMASPVAIEQQLVQGLLLVFKRPLAPALPAYFESARAAQARPGLVELKGGPYGEGSP